MKKITWLLSLAILMVSCKKDVLTESTPNYVKVTLLDSSNAKVWIEVRPEKTQPYYSNGFSGAYSTNATKVSTFNYNDTFWGLIFNQSKSLQLFKFYVVKNGIKIDTQLRQNAGVFGYDAKNGDEYIFVIKDN